MARIHFVSASRKEYICSKCGKVIPVGSSYCYGKIFRRRTLIRRCRKCGLRSYELSASPYVSAVGAIVEDWQRDYGFYGDMYTSIADSLQEIRDGQAESLENMPDMLRDGDTGMLLQERIEQLEETIRQLEELSFETMVQEAFSSLDEEVLEILEEEKGDSSLENFYYRLSGDKEIESVLAGDGSNYTLSQAFNSWKEEVESIYSQSIDDILGDLTY